MNAGESSKELAAVPVRAVIWDYDGTLVDTRLKNLRVTRAIVTAVTGRPIASFPALASVAAFVAADRRAANWRELNSREYGLSDDQAEEMGRLWTTYQLQDRTPTTFFPGVAETLACLADMPQAIFSQNSRAAIKENLVAAGLDRYFGLIVGYEEVAFTNQKPAPDGLLFCLKEMGLERGAVFFVGDHVTDILCARRANAVLAKAKSELRVIAVGAVFGGAKDTLNWSERPDHLVQRPGDVADLAAKYGSI